MASVDYKFRSVKLDQTPYLFHFTKGDFKEAKNSLYSILQSQQLISKSSDYICFTASPVTSLYSFFDVSLNRTGLPMYQPFGIGFHRDILIKDFNARNVIYSTREEINKLPEDLHWRSQLLEIGISDFEYLREWRIQNKVFNFSNFPRDQILVIAPTIADIHDLVVGIEEEPSILFNPISGEFFEDTEIVYPLMYKALSLGEIKQFCTDDYQVWHASNNQALFENKEKELMEDMRTRCSK